MASTDCMFHKFGHCKFGDVCRHRHLTEICTTAGCIANLCEKRHPRNCIYHMRFDGCKFGDHCSYMHPEIEGQKSADTEIKVMESRIIHLEQLLEAKEDETKLLNEKISNLKSSFTKLEKEMAGIGIVMEKAVENAVTSLLQKININQDEKEKQREQQFVTLNAQLSILANAIDSSSFKTSPQIVQSSNSQLNKISSIDDKTTSTKCNICGKSYRNQNDLMNHERSTHRLNF